MLKKSKLITSYTNLAIIFGYIGFFGNISHIAPLICYLGLNTTLYRKIFYILE